MYNEHDFCGIHTAIQLLRDELAIKNMIKSLDGTVMFTEEERNLIEDAVRSHIILSAQMAIDKAQKGVYSNDEQEYKLELK